ncbi:MAG: DUF4337 family protein [Rhodobacter sp.]|nr:DUF4337 family protein [Rhodobacter sp.]
MGEENDTDETAMKVIEEHEGAAPWVDHAALGAMVASLFSVVGAVLAGISANEAIVDRQEQIADLLISGQAVLENEILGLLSTTAPGDASPPEPVLAERLDTHPNAAAHAAALKQESASVLQVHERLAIGVAVMSASITLSGMAVLVRRRSLWWGAVAMATSAAAVIVWGAVDFFA